MTRRDPTPSFSVRIGTILRQTTVYHNFGSFSPTTQAWSPAVNIYQLPDRLEVCVDLAGVDRRELEVRVEAGRLLIQGIRKAPEPHHRRQQPMRIVGMEIDYGPFRRVVALPETVDLDRVHSTYTDGLLWITLPLKPSASQAG